MSGEAVSVIIPAYRASRTIRRAVDSVLAQTRPPEEILVVDDGSPDDLATALAPYGDRVILIRKPNGGAASARNLGIDRARGDLIAFLDADDYWEPAKLARQLDVLNLHPEVGLIAGRYYTQAPGGARWLDAVTEDGLLGRPIGVSGERCLAVASWVWTSTTIVRREVLGGHRFESGLEPAEDRDLWLRIVATSPAYLAAEPLATLVLEPNSLSRSNVDVDCGNMLRVVRRHEALLGQRGRRQWEADTYRRWAAVHLGQGRPAAAILPAWERLRREPTNAQAWWIMLKCIALATPSPPDRGLR